MKIPTTTHKWLGIPGSMRWCVRHWRERRDEGFRLRVTHGAITIITRGGVYRIPRSRYLSVSCSAATLRFAGGEDVTVVFADPAAAKRALRRLGRRLVSNRPLVWAGRGLALAVCWLLVSSYLTVRQRQQAGAPTVAAAATPAPMPAPQGPLQALPGIPATTAPDGDAPGPLDVAPSVVPSVPISPAPATQGQADMGLSGFGLQLNAGAMTQGASLGSAAFSPAPAPGADAASTTGPGCDPHLAFQAPAR